MVRPVSKDLQSYEPYYRPTHNRVGAHSYRGAYAQSAFDNKKALVAIAGVAGLAYAHFKLNAFGLRGNRRRR